MKFKNYSFWTSLAGSAVVVFGMISKALGLEISDSIAYDIVMGIAGVLVILGVVKMPPQNAKPDEDQNSNLIESENLNLIEDENSNLKTNKADNHKTLKAPKLKEKPSVKNANKSPATQTKPNKKALNKSNSKPDKQ